MSGRLVDGGGHRQPHFFAHVTTASPMTGNATIGHNYRSTGSYNVRASQEICHSPPDAHPSKVRCGEKKLKMANVELHFKAELKCITNSLLARSFEVHWPWAASSVAVDSLVMPNSDHPLYLAIPILGRCGQICTIATSRNMTLPPSGINSFQGVERCWRKLFSQLRAWRSLTGGRNSNSEVNFGC